MTKSSSPVLTGQPRLLGDGQRPWRATLYAPAGRYRMHRVVFKEVDGDEWTWTARTAPSEAEARAIFHQVERALDAMSTPPARASVQRARTGNALAEAYLADSRTQGKAVRTIEQRENRLRRHVLPVLGELPVAQWRVVHSRGVIADARTRGVRSARIHRVSKSRGRVVTRGCPAV